MDEVAGAATRRIEIVALACTAIVAITLRSGLPIVRIVAREGAGLNGDDVDHDDCAGLRFDIDATGPWPAGVHVVGGRLLLDLPGSLDLSAYQAELHEALAGFRMRILETPGDRVGRAWTPSPPREGGGTGTIAEQTLFTIDPVRRMPMVARYALAARRNAILRSQGSKP